MQDEVIHTRCDYCTNNARSIFMRVSVGAEVRVCSLCLHHAIIAAKEDKAEVSIRKLTRRDLGARKDQYEPKL